MGSPQRDVSIGYRAQDKRNVGTSLRADDVARKIEAIRNDRLHGATFLAGETLRTLALAVDLLPSGEERIPTMKAVGERLAQTRPSMAAIGYAVKRFLAAFETTGEGPVPHELANNLMGEMDGVSQDAARNAAAIVYDGARVLTCSYSSAVLRTFEAALASGKRITVAALESRSGELAYGQRLLDQVSSLGISTILVPDDSISEEVGQADMVLVGADKLLPDCSIVNGRPSLALAGAAKEAIPLYVVCESYKRDSDPVTEEGFDLVPASLITGIITDDRP